MLIISARLRVIESYELSTSYVDQDFTCVSLLHEIILKSSFQAQKSFFVKIYCKLQVVMFANSVC
jgi:hypothetical protein